MPPYARRPSDVPTVPPAEHWRRAARLFSLTAAFCVLIAAVLTLARPDLGSFWRNLWFSECIGLAVSGTGLAVRSLPGVRSLPARRSYLLSTLAAMPLGYVLGYAVAYSALGEPIVLGSFSDNRRVAILATVIAASFVAYLVWLRNRLAEEAVARAHAQRLAAESELRLLRAQLEPHMLFNTLANLRSLIDEDPDQARHMTDLLITYLRAALGGSRTDLVPLQAEFAQLEAYLEILRLRLGRRLTYQLTLDPAAAQASVPAMLMQPLVENAVKHGIEPKIGGGDVRVDARRDGEMLVLCVDDTGLGLPPDFDPMRPSASYGLLHVQERLRALYGDRASVLLRRREPTGTRVLVRIPS